MIAATLFAAAVLAATTQSAPLNLYARVPLSAALDASVAASPAVQQSRAHIAELRALLDAAQRSSPLQAVASHSDAPQSGPSGGTVDQSFTTLGGTYSFTAASQRAPAVAQAKAALAAAEADARDAVRRERDALIDHYFAALRAQAEVDVRRSLVGGAQRDLSAAQIRYRAGAAPRLDVVRAQVDLTRAGADLDSARVAADNALDALAVQTGIDRTTFATLEGVSAPALPSGDEKALVARALAQRSDVLAARRAVDVERAAVQATQKSTFPDLTLTAGYTQGVDAGTFVRGPSATVALGVPIGSNVKDRSRAGTERVHQAELHVAQVERDVRLEVTAALRTAQAASRAVQGAQSALRAATEEERAVETGYRSGASSSLEVAEARRIVAEAAIHSLDARYAEAQSRATLLEVIGS